MQPMLPCKAIEKVTHWHFVCNVEIKRFCIMELNICESRRFLKYCLRRNIANSASEMIFCFSTSNFCCWWPALQNVKSRLFRKSFTLAAFNVTCSAKLEQQIWKCSPSENVARSASEMHKVYLISLQVKVSFIQDKLCTCRFQCNLQLRVWPAPHHQIVTVELAID